MTHKTRHDPYTIDDLRGVLSEVLDNLREGSITPAVANATNSAVGKMLSTVRLQMDYQKMTGRASSAIRVLESGR